MTTTMSLATSFNHTFRTWPNRQAMARAIRKEQRTGFIIGGWQAIVPLDDETLPSRVRW